MVLSVLVGLAGIFIARLLYISKTDLPAKITARLSGLHRLVFNKYFIDELYENLLVKPGYFLSEKVFFRVVDAGIIDGIVNGLGITVRIFGTVIRLVQTGVVRTYALFIVFGVLFLIYRMVG